MNPTRRNHFLVLLLASSFGVVFLARNALGFLSPFIATDLDLSNQQIGLLASAFSIAWAVSGVAVTALAGGVAQRALLAGLLCALGVASLASSFAMSFLTLFLARLASGICGGPVLPLVQSFTANLGSNTHRGLRMGVVQGLGSSLIGAVLAPLLLIPIAVHWGWRGAFLAVATAAALSGVAIARSLLPTPSKNAHSGERRLKLPLPLNITLCSLIGAAMVAWLTLTLTFLPLYLVNVQHRSTVEMGTLMSLAGIGSLLGTTFLAPYLSDRFGSRRVMIAFTLAGVLSPLGVLVPHAPLTLLCLCLLVGSFAAGTFPLFMAVIPAESVPQQNLAPSIGIVQGLAEIAGGVATPIAAGWAADHFGLEAPLLIALATSLLAAVLSVALKKPGAPDPHAALTSDQGRLSTATCTSVRTSNPSPS